MSSARLPAAAADLSTVRIALVAPRNMRFSAHSATSIDLHIHETARWSAFRRNIVVMAEEIDEPFEDVRVRFWPRGRSRGHLERLLDSERPDLIVAHQHLPTAARLAARFPGTPVALVRHNFQRPPRNRLSALFKRRSFARLAALAFVSERCRRQFEIDWPQVHTPRCVTPNGVDSRLWRPAPEKERVALFVGRLAPEKGVLEAAEGLAEVLAHREDWRARFILAKGAAPEDYARAVHAALGRLGARAEVLLDAPHARVRDAMARAAIAVAPTQGEESFGRVAVEAMASGAAVVASRASGFVEVIGEAGVLLDRPDAAHVAAAVGRLIDAPGERRALSRAARARVEARWDLAHAARAFDGMAATLLSGHPLDAPVDLAGAIE
jgi:glycosyltransferase involved in cell wall biosynthesis